MCQREVKIHVANIVSAISLSDGCMAHMFVAVTT